MGARVRGARRRSPSAAWYNPAGLGSLPSPVFDASLDRYELSFLTREGAVRVDLADYEASRGALAGVVGARLRAGAWRLGRARGTPSLPLHDELTLCRSQARGVSAETPGGLYARRGVAKALIEPDADVPPGSGT